MSPCASFPWQVSSLAMKRIVKRLVPTVLLLIAAALLFVLTRPSVWYVEEEVPSYAFPRPSVLTKDWKLSSRKPELVIVTPLARVPGTDARAVLFGRLAENGERVDAEVLIDEEAMWETALSPAVECILYEASDAFAESLASYLVERDSNAFTVTYESRVGASNCGKLEEEASGADRVFLLTPLSSVYFARHTGKDLVTDFRDKAALESTQVEYSVGIDMDGMVRNFLSGKYELPYALIAVKE